MKTFAKIIGYGLVILLIAAAVGFTYKFTNGFNEDFKTFYVEYDGNKILSTQSTLELESGKTHTFSVKYTFDKQDTKPKDYSVKIVPNMSKDFDYTVNGERYLFSKITDLTVAFKIDKKDTSFDITMPAVISLQYALAEYHNGAQIEIDKSAIENNPNPFTLVISSYNNAVVYNIGLQTVDMQVDELKVCIDGTDVTGKHICLYGRVFEIEVYAKVNGEWIDISEAANISTDIGGDIDGNCLTINVVVSAYDYASLYVRYGSKTAHVAYCTNDEGESGWLDV